MNAITRASFGICLSSLVLFGCGAASTTETTSPRPLESVPEVSSPQMVEIWSRPGRVSSIGGWGLSPDAVFVVVSQLVEPGGWEQRLHRIDSVSREAISRSVGEDIELIRVDPLIVNTWDGQAARWRGTHIARLSDTLEPIWLSEPMNMALPRHHSGPLVIVERSQRGEYVGLDPMDGRVVFRLRGEPDGIFGEAAEAETFIATPTMDRAILTDRATGEISGVVAAGFGRWRIVGDRLVVHHPDRLVAYDGQGQEVWSRAGEFPNPPARTVLSWSADQPPGHSDLLMVWQRGRGLVALDEAGEERWVHAELDEEAWGYIMLRDGHVFLGLEEASTLLDMSSGELLFSCSNECSIQRVDDAGILVKEMGPDGAPSLTLYDDDGESLWTHTLELALNERGEPTSPQVGLTNQVVAVCGVSTSVTFLDRADGRVLSTHPLPSVPEGQDSGSAHCSLKTRDDLVLAVTEQGAALFGPARDDRPEVAEPPPTDSMDRPAEATEGAETPDPDEVSEPPPLYVLSTRVPPADGPPSQAYTDGRAAYRRARESFEAGRFEEAASGFVAAYRAFVAATDGDVQRLGLECCYDARVSLDHAGDASLREAFVEQLTGEDERCGRFIVNAPHP